MGRIARAEGAPAIVPPYAAPSETELADSPRSRRPAGEWHGAAHPRPRRPNAVPAERRRLGLLGPALACRQRQAPGIDRWSTPAAFQRQSRRDPPRAGHASRRSGAPRQVEADYAMLRAVGAHETIREQFNTRAAERPEVATLAERLAAGPIEDRPARHRPAPPKRRPGGWRSPASGMELAEDRLAFGFAPPAGERLALAEPMAHPWLPGRNVARSARSPSRRSDWRRRRRRATWIGSCFRRAIRRPASSKVRVDRP